VTHTFQDYGVGARYVKFYHGGTYGFTAYKHSLFYISFAVPDPYSDPDPGVKFQLKVYTSQKILLLTV
jgi:hypothetical protein